MRSDLCNRFLNWQCRIRQIAMREGEGRPSQGMMPRVTGLNGDVVSNGVIVLLIRLNPEESTDFFRFQVQKNHDPQEVYSKALTYLQATHYHGAMTFSDAPTASFAPGSAVASRLLADRQCILEFSQFGQEFALPCRVEELVFDDPAFQATIWHNRCFNPRLGDDVTILQFVPDWAHAR